jgi:serine/threonine protein kinase
MAGGSGTAIHPLGPDHIMKFLLWADKVNEDGLATERTLMELMKAVNPKGAAAYGIATIHAVQSTEPTMSDYCRSRFIVMDRVPGMNIRDAADEPSHPLPFYKVAAKAIAALKKFHESGFAHGDIHWENVMVDANFFVRLIDLGRANPFADEIGKQIPPQPPGEYYYSARDIDPINFSPWHTSSKLGTNYRSTRRDDLFRLAEIMLRVSWPGYVGLLRQKAIVSGALNVILLNRFKLDPGLATLPDIPQLFKDFYTYTMGLDFDTGPDYDRWIDIFTPPGGI